MKLKNVFFVFLFIVILILFGFMYFLGIMNLFMRDSSFFEKFRWLDFGKPILSLFYLGILSIFFIVIVSIMARIILSLKNESKVIDDYSIKHVQINKSQKKEELITKEIELDNHFFQKMEENISIDNRIAIEAGFQDKIDEIYKNLFELTEDIVKSNSIADLFEKSLYWAAIVSNSKKASLMAVDKNKELYIFKSIGWDTASERKFKNIKIPLGSRISGVAASENRKIYVKNIDECKEFDFRFKNEYESKSFVSIPIFGHHRVVAVLNLTDNKNIRYNQSEIDGINIIASLSSKVFELIQIKRKNKISN